MTTTNAISTTRLSELATTINENDRLANGAAAEALSFAKATGDALCEAKALLPHGDWLDWLRANTTVSPRTSQKFMRLAENWTAIEANAKATSHSTIEGAIDSIATKQESDAYCEDDINDDEIDLDDPKYAPRKLVLDHDEDGKPLAPEWFVPGTGNFLVAMNYDADVAIRVDPHSDDTSYYLTILSDFSAIYSHHAVTRVGLLSLIPSYLREVLNDVTEGEWVVDERLGEPDSGYHWLTSDDDFWWIDDVSKFRRSNPCEAVPA